MNSVCFGRTCTATSATNVSVPREIREQPSNRAIAARISHRITVVATNTILPVPTLERLQIPHLFLCRKCSHNMLPLQSLQYGRNFPCSQVRRLRCGRLSKLSRCGFASLVDENVENGDLDDDPCIELLISIAKFAHLRNIPAIRCPCRQQRPCRCGASGLSACTGSVHR